MAAEWWKDNLNSDSLALECVLLMIYHHFQQLPGISNLPRIKLSSCSPSPPPPNLSSLEKWLFISSAHLKIWFELNFLKIASSFVYFSCLDHIRCLYFLELYYYGCYFSVILTTIKELFKKSLKIFF